MTSVLSRSEFTAVEPAAPYDLDDRYRSGAGPVLLTGVQAIARMMVEQHVRDLRAGRRVATFVSGYQGSPLGGVDKMLLGMPSVLTEHDVVFTPASTRNSPPPRSGAARPTSPPEKRPTTASSASGTARGRASTAPATCFATPTTPARRSTAVYSR